MFEGFRRRNQSETPPWPELIPAPEPAAGSDPPEPEVYHPPRRLGPGARGAAPPGAGPDLDPQRLDGRSPTLRATSPPRRPAARDRDADQVLQGALSDLPARVDPPKMDVATRPRRTYPVRWPNASRETRVRPEYHGVGVLRAATPARGRLRTRGLGLMFPPHTVHARDSTSAVSGATCELLQVDHVHIRQAVVAADDTLRSGPVREIVARVRPGQDPTDAVRELLRALNEPPASRQLRADCLPSLHRAHTVQLGDDAMTHLDSRYVVERTIVPAGALLAARGELARRYLAVVAGAADDPGALARFLGDLIGAAENALADNVLGYADGLPDQRATVLGLFGLVTVDSATSVMIGVG